MPQQSSTENENRIGNLRIVLALSVTWSFLAGSLTLCIYKFHLSGPMLYVLAFVPAVPLCVMILLAVRSRASELDTYVRQYQVGVIIYAVSMLLVTALNVVLTSFFVTSLKLALLISVFPLPLGVLTGATLLMPRRMLTGGKLSLQPVRIKLATPSLRRLFRMTVLYLVYITLNFASSFIFDGFNPPPAGILAYTVVLLPVLPLFGLIPIYKKYMTEEQDEFQRHLFHQSILWALFGTLIIASVMGRLQDHALIGHTEFFRSYSVFPVFWWLQFEAVFLVNAVQGFRVYAQEKRDR